MANRALPFPPPAAETGAHMETTDRRAIVGAATDYVVSYLDGDAVRMASCLLWMIVNILYRSTWEQS